MPNPNHNEKKEVPTFLMNTSFTETNCKQFYNTISTLMSSRKILFLLMVTTVGRRS